MGASSVTGVSGTGTSGKLTTNELSQLANGPSILIAGIASTGTGGDPESSPPSDPTGTVTFPRPLPGNGNGDPGSCYCVILTTLNGGYAYVTDMDDQDLDGDEVDDHFTGFSFIAEEECDVMYIVTKIGIRA